MGKQWLQVEDILYYRDKVLDKDPYIEYVGWEFPDGKILLLHPVVKIFESAEHIRRHPGSTLCLQTVLRPDGTKDYMPPENMKKKWWQFWRS